MLAPCKLPFVSDRDTAGIIRSSLGILPRPLYVTALCLTGDWCSTTRQSPPLHINYLSRPPNFHKRTSRICSQMTLHCLNSPQNQSLVRVLFFVNHSLDTNNRHSCAVGPDSRSQTSTWSLANSPPTHRGGCPPDWTSPLEFSPARLCHGLSLRLSFRLLATCQKTQ